MPKLPPHYLTRRFIEGTPGPSTSSLEVQTPPVEEGIELFYKPDAPHFHKTAAWAASLTPDAGDNFLETLMGKLADGSEPLMVPRSVGDVVFMFGTGAYYGTPSTIADTHSLALSWLPGYTVSTAQVGVFLEASFRQRAAHYIEEAASYNDAFYNAGTYNKLNPVGDMELYHQQAQKALYAQLVAMAQGQMINAAVRQATVKLHDPRSVIEFLDTSKWKAPKSVPLLINPFTTP